jgi:hypothetical protein
MPALPDVPNVLRADLQFHSNPATPITTKLFFRYSGGPPNATDCTNLAASIWPLVQAMNGLWDLDTVLLGVKVTDLSSASGGVGEHAQSGSAGTGGSVATGGASPAATSPSARRAKPRAKLSGPRASPPALTAPFRRFLQG